MDQRPPQHSSKWFLLLYPFLLLAATGFVLTLLANLAVLLGVDLPMGLPVRHLFTGIFVVWFPTVLVAARVTKSVDRKDLWKVLLSGAPAWMRVCLYVAIAYGAACFLLFVATKPHSSEDSPEAFIRFASGHCLIFYGIAFVSLYSVTSAPKLLAKHMCPNGHSVSPVARFCSVCGQPISSDAVTA